MKARRISLALAAIALATASIAAHADIVFTNLGANPPPATLGAHAMTPFDLAPQEAIPNSYSSTISLIPGGPGGTSLLLSAGVYKATAGGSWGTDPWPGPFTGPIYFSGDSLESRTVTLPANTTAFYLYVQSNYDANPMDTITVTTNSGATSGPVMVQTGFWAPNVGANGFAFHSTAGETITSVTVQTDNPSGFAMGNFGIATGPAAPATTCASEGYTYTKLEWCKNICERGYTGSTLAMWIRRWTDRYRTLPYCAVDTE